MAAKPLLPNKWHLRRVADSSSKACWICFKPSTSVLITPDNKDFFYVCPGHLKDRGFCTPDADEAAAAAERLKKAELEKEIEKVKKEYEEKQKARKAKKKEKEKAEDKDKKDDKEKTKEDEQDVKDEAEKEAKIKALTKPEAAADDGPRIFSLQKTFYQQRVDRIRNNEIAKRKRQMISNPASFPSVPSGNPSSTSGENTG